MNRIHDNGQDDPLEFNPDQEQADLIRAELFRQRYQRESETSRENHPETPDHAVSKQ